MPADQASQTSCYVLVDGRKVMEMQDADAAPRDWEWLRRRPREKSDMVERTTACPRQTKCLIAVEAGQYFEIYIGNARSDDISSRVYVDGALVSKKITKIARPQERFCAITSSSFDDNARRTGYKQKMRFAPIAAREPGAPALVDYGAAQPQSQQGRIDVVVYRQLGAPRQKQATISRQAGSMTTAAAAGGGKKNVFGMGAAFDAPQRQTNQHVYVTEKDPTPIATYSFRYAAIESLHLSKTTPKVWLDGQTAEIDATRLRSREMRSALRAGYAITEPPTYLWTTELSPLGGARAPRAVAATAELDSKLRSEGFKLCGEARGLFDALSHQLCGTHQLSAYVEHVVVAELERREAHEESDKKLTSGGEWRGDEYGPLFRSAKSPLRHYDDWRDLVASRRAAKGSVRVGARYDDPLALKDDPPPLVPGDLVRIEAPEDAIGHAQFDDYEASVQASSDKQNVVLKRLGAAEETLKRSSWRVGCGLVTRRGAHVVEMQHAVFLQAFANAFGVRVFMLSVTGRSRKLRVVRVEPRPGRRVLINGYAVAHLGGVAFDSITRHHEVIEIASDDEEEEEEEEEPEREPSPEPPPRKRPRRARVKTEIKAER